MGIVLRDWVASRLHVGVWEAKHVQRLLCTGMRWNFVLPYNLRLRVV